MNAKGNSSDSQHSAIAVLVVVIVVVAAAAVVVAVFPSAGDRDHKPLSKTLDILGMGFFCS